MQLTPRLKAIADSIDICKSVADIGSDHAYLPIYLAINGKIEKAIATDVNTGPAYISRERIKRYGQEEVIDVRIGYGLKVLNHNEADIIIISGMGGLLIIDIIKESLDVARSSQIIILQPMKDSYLLRKWLVENYFDIADVEIVKEDNKFYEIIWAVPNGKSKGLQVINYIDDKLLNKKTPVLLEYIDSKIYEYETIIKKLEIHNTPNAVKRYKQCYDMLEYYKEVKTWVQQNAE